jgi:hypothetical protein
MATTCETGIGLQFAEAVLQGDLFRGDLLQDDVLESDHVQAPLFRPKLGIADESADGFSVRTMRQSRNQ